MPNKRKGRGEVDISFKRKELGGHHFHEKDEFTYKCSQARSTNVMGGKDDTVCDFKRTNSQAHHHRENEFRFKGDIKHLTTEIRADENAVKSVCNPKTQKQKKMKMVGKPIAKKGKGKSGKK